MKINLIVLLCLFLGTSAYSQEDQSFLISEVNTKLREIDSVLIISEYNQVPRLINELLPINELIEDPEIRFGVYGISIHKYIAAKMFHEAITLGHTSLKKIEEYCGTKQKDVAYLTNALSLSYAYDGQLQNAIVYGKQAVEILEGANDYGEEYITYLSLLANYYNVNEQYPESILMLKKALQYIDVDNIPASRLAIIYRSLAANYSSLNNYYQAQQFTEKAIELYEDKQSLNYIGLKQELAWFYSNNNNYEKAILLIDEVCDSLKARNCYDLYAIALCDKASIYILSKDDKKISEAIMLANKAISIFEMRNDILSDKYVHSLMTLAKAYRSLDLFDNKSQEIYKRVYDLQKQNLDITNIDDLETLSYSAVLANNLQEGLSLFQMLKKQIIQKKGENSVDYADVVYRLSELYALLDDHESAIKNIEDALPIIRNNLSKSFFLLEDKERTEFWNKYIYVFSESLPRICYASSNPKFSGLMFDASLLSKGILLNTERLKRKLMQEEASVDNFVKPFFLNWRDIQDNLKDDDIAIEFVKVNPFKDFPVYVAVTIRRQYITPKLTILFIEDELKQVSDTLYYQCKEMTNLVWVPLLSELEGIKNIYFSPSGALYNIGIEYLPGMEDYNIYRLSSTRELVTGGKNGVENRAVLYGGLDYYAGLGSIQSQTEDDMYIEHANVRGMKLRGGKESLPQTKVEVKQIGKELENARWDCNLLTDGNGTEESFKSLAGKKVYALHIATHGFYYSPEEADNMKYDFLLLDNKIASAEDKSLTRSGLILSGANHILEGEDLPDNVEDGILTAKEIADVDLRGLDLVVLSACQTGLGDISQGEGVFGLQRGFKKAGANSILMSLWEVDDKATQILMTQFYKNWLSGQSKRQSLLSAQKHLRKTEGGKYNEPKYWAAFILLDGIK